MSTSILRVDPAAARSRFVLFSFAWGMYGFLHYALTYFSWLHFQGLELPLGAATMLASVAVLARPSSVRSLVVLVGLWLVHEVYRMPDIANHMLLTTLVNLTILLSLAYRSLRGPGRLGWPAAAMVDLGPLLRLELLGLYFYAVLHKLNAGYFDPQVSCGWTLYAQMADSLGVLPTADLLRWPALIGALTIEAAIPVMLIFARTRTIGVLLGAAFHLMLALHHNIWIASFTSMLLALYTLFLPATFLDRLSELWQGSALRSWWRPHRQAVVGALVAAPLLGVAGLVTYAAMLGELHKQGVIAVLHQVVPPLVRLLFFGWALTAIALVIRVLRVGPHHQPAVGRVLGPRLTPGMLGVALVFLNGMSPYLGLKTESSFAMYSNLRTEAGEGNHLFMPVLSLGGYQDDLVTLLAASDPDLGQWAELGERLPYFELRRRVNLQSDETFFVEYEYNGEVQRVTLTNRHDVLPPPTWWTAKLLHFRRVPPPDELCTCRH